MGRGKIMFTTKKYKGKNKIKVQIFTFTVTLVLLHSAILLLQYSSVAPNAKYQRDTIFKYEHWKAECETFLTIYGVCSSSCNVHLGSWTDENGVISFFQSEFEKLDPENLSSTTVKYGKSVYQLEKGLPPNNVVPQLKERVENMKDKVG